MTEETKKLIESVTVFTQHDVVCSGGLTEWVGESDFYRVVEELTKWNKVEDGFPEKQGHYLVRVKSSFPKNCNVIVCEFYEDNKRFYSESGDEPIYDAIEWSPIN